jgi:hypothetical protein
MGYGADVYYRWCLKLNGDVSKCFMFALETRCMFPLEDIGTLMYFYRNFVYYCNV